MIDIFNAGTDASDCTHAIAGDSSIYLIKKKWIVFMSDIVNNTILLHYEIVQMK